MRARIPSVTSICLALLACFASVLIAQSSSQQVLRVRTRLVEVYATIYDSGGRYVDGLSKDDFEVLEDGKPQEVAIFETNVERLSCVVLLDTTGSMTEALPRVKNAVIKLIDSLGPRDSVAIYTFDSQVTQHQELTTDKASAKRAVLRLRAQGQTALFDSISEVAQDISAQPGKKAMVVFTNGDDNASMLNSTAAVARVQKLGIPLYTIAEGDALQTPQLKKLLKQLSENTGAMAYEARKGSDIEEIFQEISRDLQHLYLISYKPPQTTSAPGWRKIEVAVKKSGGYRIRAKQGYTAD